MDSFFHFVDENLPQFISVLREAVSIPSVSSDFSMRKDVFKMSSFLTEKMQRLGVHTRLVDPGTQQYEGRSIQLPPIILGSLGSDSSKKTLLIYGS